MVEQGEVIRTSFNLRADSALSSMNKYRPRYAIADGMPLDAVHVSRSP
jgi:hypothetical protein